MDILNPFRFKSHNWFKSYCHSWVLQMGGFCPGIDPPNIVQTTKNNVDHIIWGVYQQRCGVSGYKGPLPTWIARLVFSFPQFFIFYIQNVSGS